MDELLDDYDVVVIGGGPAGLNGALMLARSRRTVAVVDAGSPRNAPADAMHGYLGHDGLPPQELLKRGRAEVRSYGGHIVNGEVASAIRDENTFVVTLSDGRRTHARRLLVTTGLVDELPDVAGVKELWGHDVLHCPYCHGWEVRDKAIGILATSRRAMHLAQLFRQLSDDITYFAHTTPPSAEEAEQLAPAPFVSSTGASPLSIPSMVASLEWVARLAPGLRATRSLWCHAWSHAPLSFTI